MSNINLSGSPVDSVWTRKTTRLCRLSSCRPCVISLCQLVVTSPIVILSLHCPLVHSLSTCHPLIVSSSCCAASRCLVAPAGCGIIISHHPLVAPPSPLLIMLAGCCVASPCAHHPVVLSRQLVVKLPILVLFLRHPLVNLSRQLVVALLLLFLSLHPMPPSHPLVAMAG